MKKLTRQEKHEQCMREIRGTLIVVLICCAWHIASAFLLNGTGLYFLGMPHGLVCQHSERSYFL